MPDKASKALAITAEIPNLPAVGSTITAAQAIQIARQIGAAELRRAKAERRAKIDEVGKSLGGQITRIDQGVVDQARQLAARLAAISQHRKSGRGYGGGADPLDGIVKKLGGIIGELEATMLLDRAVGLFEEVHEHEYRVENNRWNQPQDWQAAVGQKARDAARDVLEQFTIVDESAVTTPKPKRGAKNVTPAPIAVNAADVAHDGVADAEDDAENDEGDGGE